MVTALLPADIDARPDQLKWLGAGSREVIQLGGGFTNVRVRS